MVRTLDLYIRFLLLLSGFALGRPEFNNSAALYKKPVGLSPVGWDFLALYVYLKHKFFFINLKRHAFLHLLKQNFTLQLRSVTFC